MSFSDPSRTGDYVSVNVETVWTFTAAGSLIPTFQITSGCAGRGGHPDALLRDVLSIIEVPLILAGTIGLGILRFWDGASALAMCRSSRHDQTWDGQQHGYNRESL
jgi:hypothetical protein